VANGTLWAIHHSGGLPLIEMSSARIGWPDAGDLTGLPDDREAFKAHLRDRFPDNSAAWIANAAGQLLRFTHVMQVGELIVYPQKSDRTVNIGQITGNYAYDPKTSTRYPNSRSVKWIKPGISRDVFTQGCLYELGSAMSVFTVKTHNAEILTRVGIETPSVDPVAPLTKEEPPEVDEPTAERINESTRDYVLKTFNSEMKGHGFAQWCAWLLETLGYTTRVSPPGADGGVDIVATEDPLGVKRPLLKVQCKSGTGAIGSPEVQALNGTLADNELGLFIALGGFTGAARHAASGMPKMRLIESEELLDLTLEHYPALGDEAKEALRLRRVWVPDQPPIDG
jgi:restriction system protein